VLIKTAGCPLSQGSNHTELRQLLMVVLLPTGFWISGMLLISIFGPQIQSILLSSLGRKVLLIIDKILVQIFGL